MTDSWLQENIQDNPNDEFMNFLMDGFGSESYMCLDYALLENAAPAMDGETVANVANSNVVPVPDNSVETDWSNQFKEIDSNDLIDSPDPFGIKSLAKYIFDQPAETTINNMYENTDMNSFPEAVTPGAFEAEVLADVKQEAVPKTRTRGRKPKTSLISDPSLSAAHTMELRDVKPSSSSLKRIFDEASNMSSTSVSGGKKMKKYMQDSDDPAVKNAKAAKLNRIRKKEEMESMKTELEISKKTIEEYKFAMAQTRKELAELKREKEAVHAKYLTSNGLRGVAPSIRDYLSTTIPALQEAYGRFEVEFS